LLRDLEHKKEQRQEQTRYQSCLTLCFLGAIRKKRNTSLLLFLQLEALRACGNSEQTDTTDHLTVASCPCICADPGESQELGTSTSHTRFPQKAAAHSDLHHIMQTHIIHIWLCVALGTRTADHGSLL